MAMTMLQFTLCVGLLTGALGLPLFSEEEEAKQLLGPKKQTDYWQLSGNQSTLGEQISETKTALKKTASQYTELEPSVSSTETAKDHVSSDMDKLQQSGAHLKQPTRQHDIHTRSVDKCPWCGCPHCDIILTTKQNK